MEIKVTTSLLFSTIAAFIASLMTLGAGNIGASVAFFLSAVMHFISYLVIKHDESGDGKNVPGP